MEVSASFFESGFGCENDIVLFSPAIFFASYTRVAMRNALLHIV